ncbi:MAG: phosphatidate cytidylyltransferase [Cellvibrionaceae bacterium]|nr:phosphatidate cytidylyltransferase [Cellvibrionaceae bacterium]
MLRQRVVTASVLATAFLLVLFYGPWQIFAAFTGLVFLLSSWEWADLSGFSSKVSRSCYTALTLILGLGLGWAAGWGYQKPWLQLFFSAVVCWWVIALVLVKGYPGNTALWGGKWVRAFMGWLVLLPAWIACIYLRSDGLGPWVVLLVVLIVATADITAFFAGRAFGKRKLAPRVSPGKSWEGVWAGMALAALLGLCYNLFFEGISWLNLVIIILPTAFASVLGDLLESMVKRHRGVKDSGSLLPGHGGLLDRVDGLVAAGPTFSLLVLFTGWSL